MRSDWYPEPPRTNNTNPKEDPVAIDMEAMLNKIKGSQWALADID